MNILQRIEKRVVLPGDSEIRRSQKVLAAMIYITAGPTLLFNAIGNFSAGLSGVGWAQLALSIFLIAAFLVEIKFPAYHVPLAYTAFLVSLVVNLLAHLFAGGTTSGNFNIAWAVLTPLLAVLLVDRRALLLTMIPFMLVVLGVIFLEPWALAHMPRVDPFFMLFNYATSLAMLGIMIALASLYLVGQIENYRRRADDLLLNILPGTIAMRLKEDPGTIADGYDEVSVLFADIVGLQACLPMPIPSPWSTCSTRYSLILTIWLQNMVWRR
ncbi:MAG: hypothetical protein ACK2U0_21130 [Candidatus Promineifilaceae bacterium]|jgi:hypothetical protein